MKLLDLISNINHEVKIFSNKSNHTITDIVIDSRKAGSGSIFVAIKGFQTDGHKYITQSYLNGCRDFVIEDESYIDDTLLTDSTILSVENSREAVAVLCNAYYDYPFNKLRMIGITGTKGKTSVSTLVHHLLTTEQQSSLFTTVKNIVANKETDSIRTTMEATELIKQLNDSMQFGDINSVVEVSSHAVTLYRIEGIQWDIGVFTSFSRDHLDLYGTMDNYFEAKLDFFRALNQSSKQNKAAIINIDDTYGEKVCSIADESVRVIRVGTKDNADYRISDIYVHEKGTSFDLNFSNDRFRISSSLKGEFNIMNVAIAAVVALETGIAPPVITLALAGFKGIPGRFEIVMHKPFTVIVDYAHTPDSLGKIIDECLKIKQNRLITLFGCTGDRDRDKRSIMGELAGRLSDYCIITNDDTYTEDPVMIAAEVEQGFINIGKKIASDYEIILDRKQAIKRALDLTQEGDVVLLAGMGHEKVQILAQGPVPHNDRECALAFIKESGIAYE